MSAGLVDGSVRSQPLGEAPRRSPMVCLLDALPDTVRAVPPGDRPLARRAALAPLHTLPPGMPLTASSQARPFASVILDGLVLRRTWIRDRCIVEALGAGDIVDTRREDEPWSLPADTEHVVHCGATVAELDDRFRLAARRWPALHDVVMARMAGQVRHASRHLAMLALPRVEERLEMFFSDAADRWGRVTREGIVVDLPVTHALLGELVGSRRPTVSLALSELAAAGTVIRRDDGCWVVAPAQPSGA